MTRRRKTPRSTAPSEPRQHGDIGTRQRYQHGSIVIGPDSVARTQSVQERLWLADVITQGERDAADRYARDYELAGGSQDGSEGGDRRAAWERTPSQGQIDARTRIGRADKALGGLRPFAIAAFVDCASVSALVLRFGGVGGRPGTSGGRSVARVMALLRGTPGEGRGVLGVLDEHYHGAKRERAA